jgi:DNA-binding transcriptional LysR family regulator
MINMEKYISPLFLKTFRRAYETGHFTQTARDLAMTQSGVSQHVAVLEEILGQALFERVGRNILPTPVGVKLYALGGSWLSQMEDFVTEIQSGETELRGSVVLGAPGSFAQYILSAVTEWKLKHPNILLDLVYGPNTVMAEDILSGKMDLGVTTDPLDAKTYVNEEIFEQEYVLVSHPKAKIKLDSWESFCEMPFIVYPGAEAIFQKWIGAHFRKGIGKTHLLNTKFRINNMEGTLFLLQQNAGVTIYPSEPLKSLLQKNKLKLHSTGKKVSNQIYLVHRQGRALNRRSASLRDVILAVTESSR